ncbi:hypothetical protein F0U61_49240 [Archangium violaceum]|uniref:hypothetical protein n=1 Tax=Archangium violaceum TaxID=83451 RepID=UPI002B32152C|nr:hypothetical protein F0U61_49240 [Archangium violaceum]
MRVFPCTRPESPEPGLHGDVEIARRFLTMLEEPPEVDSDLASMEEAAMASEDDGCRSLLD